MSKLWFIHTVDLSFFFVFKVMIFQVLCLQLSLPKKIKWTVLKDKVCICGFIPEQSYVTFSSITTVFGGSVFLFTVYAHCLVLVKKKSQMTHKKDVTVFSPFVYMFLIQTQLQREVHSWRTFIPDCICTASREAMTSGWLTSAGGLEHLLLNNMTLSSYMWRISSDARRHRVQIWL